MNQKACGISLTKKQNEELSQVPAKKLRIIVDKLGGNDSTKAYGLQPNMMNFEMNEILNFCFEIGC